MDYFKKVSLLLLSEQCFETYFFEFNFFDAPCFKATLSKVLGLGIVAGSVMVKLPQIIKIIKNKSSAGINVYSVFFDLIAITAVLSYSFVMGFPFTSWGDMSFLATQTAIIGALVFLCEGSTTKAVLFLATYAMLCYVLMGGITPVGVLWSMQGFNMPIVFFGKMLQAYTNYKNGSTGQLSATTCFMLFFGSLARIFTSIQETGDQMMIMTYIISTTANAIIVLQLLWYWNVEDKGKLTDKQKIKGKKSQKIE